jgi:hypothetical protein
MAYYNGDVYEGYWENDKRNGKGRLEQVFITDHGETVRNLFIGKVIINLN